MLDLQKAMIEDAKKISFHTVRLEPSWFINTDATEFIFTDCKWRYAVPKLSNIVRLIKFFTNRRWRYVVLKIFKKAKKIKLFTNYKWRCVDGKRLNVKTELQNLKNRKFENPNALLTKTCWQLADNYEESKSFPKASVFRKMANESKRLEDYKGWKVWSLDWWYWLSSFYGESPLRAGLVLTGILLIFAVAFTFTNFQVCPIIKSIPEIACEPRTLNIWEAILQSLATATFQSIEYIKPNSKVGIFLIILEKIFTPLQAALLALAIRRKFMR